MSVNMLGERGGGGSGGSKCHREVGGKSLEIEI